MEWLSYLLAIGLQKLESVCSFRTTKENPARRLKFKLWRVKAFRTDEIKMAPKYSFQIWEISEAKFENKKWCFYSKKKNDQISRGNIFRNWPHQPNKKASLVMRHLARPVDAVQMQADWPPSTSSAFISPFRRYHIRPFETLANINLNILASAIVCAPKPSSARTFWLENFKLKCPQKFPIERRFNALPIQMLPRPLRPQLQIGNTNEQSENLAKLKMKIKTVECDLHFAYFLSITARTGSGN